MTLIKHIFSAVVIVSLLMPAGSLYAQKKQTDENAQLREQVQALNERVLELEKQLHQKQELRRKPSVSLGGEWDPFAEMENMQKEMNRMFRESYGRRGLQSFQNTFSFDPAADIKQAADYYVVTMDIPGMDKGNINVEVKNGALVVSGERSTQSEKSKDGQYFRQERSFGKFYRTVPLPDDIKPDEVNADYKEGVLTIKISRDKIKSKAVNPSRKINVY